MGGGLAVLLLAERCTPEPSYSQIRGGARSTRAFEDQPGRLPMNERASLEGPLLIARAHVWDQPAILVRE